MKVFLVGKRFFYIKISILTFLEEIMDYKNTFVLDYITSEKLLVKFGNTKHTHF